MFWLIISLLISISFQAHSSQLVIKQNAQTPITLGHEEIVSTLTPTQFSTHLPWFTGAKEFTGFTVTDLLAHFNIEDAFSVSFIALNDYAASSRIEDIVQYEPIVAYEVNGEKLKIRDKGPYWLIFNLDKYPEADNAVFHSQMVWQIDEILIHRHSDAEKN
ncbi:hypothetical protein EJ063_05260 [Vibrio aquaticus]|uniref:Oxidoreductase molybdopterin-binding domain-containing protein n=1 Tax=Vibrio aquaticus TaxID=2496559 RepID=A0A432D3B9_9VIBR|nr:hypothetical protein EJ063_05260 [Vibrio aquaticus]